MGDEDADSDTELALISSKRIKDNSRTSYAGKQLQFLAWLCQRNLECMTPSFLQGAGANPTQPTREYLKIFITPPFTVSRTPVFFDKVSELQLAEKFIMQLRTKTGLPVSKSVLMNARSAIFNLQYDYGYTVPANVLSAQKSFYKASLRIKQTEITATGSEIKSGKDPLDITSYRWLAEQILRLSSKEFIITHTMFVFSWNLMCRVNNVIELNLAHMEWRDDSLVVFFSQAKNDQDGEKSQVPKHIYANPLQPEICPILSLAMYFLCYPLAIDQVKLFPGKDPYNRYAKQIGTLLNDKLNAEDLKMHQIDSKHVGTHSLRKGSATYAASGTTCPPSNVAVHLRAGWSMGVVQDTYLKYQAASDHHVGRVVAGLPTGEVDFATLPPFFQDEGDELIKEAIRAFFPHLPQMLGRVGVFLTASLIYHSQWIRKTLPSDHIIFTSALFTSSYSRDLIVLCRPQKDGDQIRASGIPDMVHLRAEMRVLKESLEQLASNQERIITKAIEDAQIASGSITNSFLELKLAEFADKIMRPVATSPSKDSAQLRPKRFLHSWGGKMRSLPENYQLPKGSLAIAWQHFVCGDSESMIPPLRSVHPSDFSDHKQRNRFSDFKTVLGFLEREERCMNWWVDEPTLLQANDLFAKVCHVVYEVYTGKTNDIRVHQYSWSTFTNSIRENVKRKRVE